MYVLHGSCHRKDNNGKRRCQVCLHCAPAIERISGGTFNGTIKLYGPSVFTIPGFAQHFTINGQIVSGALSSIPTSLTLTAKDARNWGGHRAGIILEGGAPNTYRGPTIIKSGYIACNKPAGTVAIPGDIIIQAETGLAVESGLWFGANHQLSGNSKIIFERHNGSTGLISINGTTQTIAGLVGHEWTDVINNIDPNHLARIPGVPSLSTNLTEPESNAVTYSWAVSDNTMGVQSSVANQTSFEQQRLVNQSTVESSVTYTFTPLYTLSAALSCEGLPGTSVYTLRPRIVASINDATTKACLGDAITLRATVSEGATYQWLKDDLVIQDATGDSFVVTTGSESASLYAVKITNSSGCAVSDSRKVEVTEDAYFIGASAEMNPTVGEVNKPVSFDYTGPTAEYNWDFNDNTVVVTTQNASHSYSNSGTFHPVLRVVKPNQAVCKKTFALPDLRITPITGDINGSGVFSVFPVPVQDRLTIVNDGGDLQNITICDIRGKTVMSEEVDGRKAILSIAHFANGIYLLTVTDSKGVKRMKISKN